MLLNRILPLMPIFQNSYRSNIISTDLTNISWLPINQYQWVFVRHLMILLLSNVKVAPSAPGTPEPCRTFKPGIVPDNALDTLLWDEN